MSLTNSMLVVDGNAVGGDTEDLTAYQTKADNTLATTEKTVVGAINEINSNLTNYELQNNINLEVPNRKNLAGNPYNVMLNSSNVFVVANVRSYIVPTSYGKITISVDDITKISDDVIRIGYCNDIPVEGGTGLRTSNMTTNTYTITPNTGYKYIVVSNLVDNDYGWQDIQIEIGDTATPYVPYIPSVETRLDILEIAKSKLTVVKEGWKSSIVAPLSNLTLVMFSQQTDTELYLYTQASNTITPITSGGGINATKGTDTVTFDSNNRGSGTWAVLVL